MQADLKGNEDKKNSKESENTVTRVRINYKRQLIVNSNINYEQAGEFRASFPFLSIVSLDIQLVSRNSNFSQLVNIRQRKCYVRSDLTNVSQNTRLRGK